MHKCITGCIFFRDATHIVWLSWGLCALCRVGGCGWAVGQCPCAQTGVTDCDCHRLKLDWNNNFLQLTDLLIELCKPPLEQGYFRCSTPKSMSRNAFWKLFSGIPYLPGLGDMPGARGRHIAPEFFGARCSVSGDMKGGQVGYPWKGLSKCSSEMLISGR